MAREDAGSNPAGRRIFALIALAASTIFVLTVGVAGWVYFSESPWVDFASCGAAGHLALEGYPDLAYDVAAHRAVEMTVAHMGGLMPFPYPPPFLFAVAPFAFRPFWLAYLAWILVTAALYLAAARPFLQPRFVFAHPAAIVNAMIGQNGFLTSSIFLFGLSALARRPYASGAIFGLLVIKPQLAVLIPLALLASREWRAIGGAALSSLSLLVLAGLVFGWDSYRGFLAMTGNYSGYLAADRWNWAEVASVFGFFRFFGVPQVIALAAQAVAAVGAAVVTWKAWALKVDRRGAILAAAALLVPPYAFTYDSLLLVLPLGVFLADSGRPWRVPIVWIALLLPLLGYFGLYPGANTVPVAAGISLYWLATDSMGKKKAAAPFGTAASS